MNRTYLHIDLAHFFVAMALRRRPWLRERPGLPVAVGGNSIRRGYIASANPPARQRGVRVLMNYRDARRVCPDLEILPAEVPACLRERDWIAREILPRWSTRLRTHGMDEFILDISPLCTSGDQLAWHTVALEIIRTIGEERGLVCRVGAGPGLWPARLACLLARRDGQPRFLTAIQAGELAGKIPLRLVPGVGTVLTARLRALGWETLADIRAASPHYLTRVCGRRAGLYLWHLARGRDTRVLRPELPGQGAARSVSRAGSFDTPLSDPGLILRETAALLQQALDAVFREGLTPGALRVIWRQANRQELSWRSDWPVGPLAQPVILARARDWLTNRCGGRTVIQANVLLENLTRGSLQGDLFTSAAADPLVSDIRKKFGSRGLFSASLLD